MGDGNEQSCENEKVEGVLDLDVLIVADLAIDKLFLWLVWLRYARCCEVD